MLSSRFLVGFAIAISLVFASWSHAQPAPASAPPSGGAAAPTPPPVVTPVRAVPQGDDPVPPAQLSDTLKEAANFDQADVSQIDTAVGGVCATMADDTHPASQSACRDWIVQGLSTSDGSPAGATFL